MAFWNRSKLTVWYHPEYRLPLPARAATGPVDPRRADFACWYLLDRRVISRTQLRFPRRATYEDLARVHTPELLESLSDPATIARAFALSPADLHVDAILRGGRRACGGTLEAARAVLQEGGAALNLLGGFHHAGRARAGGYCLVNDVAVAIAALRDGGFTGKVAVLDLDAHPPDGTADCLQDDRDVWIGSLSAVDWGPLPGVDESVIPGLEDEPYLATLEALLGRMPRAGIAFVLAGGDVLAADPQGALALTLDGARRRDLRVAAQLTRLAIPSVWLPAGGYREDAWKLLAGTAVALARRSRRQIERAFDPLSAHFSAISRTLAERALGERDQELSMDDVAADLHLTPPGRGALLGHYSLEGIEYALFRFGFLARLRRLGYGQLRLEVDAPGPGERVRVYGSAGGDEHLLVECVLERRRAAGTDVLYLHWLQLRDPRAQFTALRPRLPGQDTPGLGMADEVIELLARMAVRLGLDGVVFRPAWYHAALGARRRFRFVDPALQGRWEAMQRDLGALPLVEVSGAFAEGRVLLDGAPSAWPAEEMALWLRPRPPNEPAVAAAREAARFSIAARASS